ncbi:glycosyltransferase family 4 protein [Streptomyces formicae]|uniref:D-inositol 3-phosphate glycosyltransferase n=1 Tax=Streptomyces formicae TaxID=1616117 RepID=A0ABY3WLP4_9ACTN|nr:glycosyltransferase family 4 protein [Streptomyces formicae]UNM13060.1 glycosyltransferase family 4 protein [Streptomyces formicae]
MSEPRKAAAADQSGAGLRVCLLVRYFTVGGLERVVTSLANELVARGVEVRVVALAVAKRNRLMTELDPRVEAVSLSGSPVRRLAAVVRLSRGHAVHIHFGDGRIHPLVRLALRGRPTVVSYHSVYTHKRTWLRNRVDQYFNTRAHQVLAVSEAVRDFCTAQVGLPPGRIEVVPNAIRVDCPERVDEGGDGGLTVISLAGLYPHKNQAAVLAAVAEARRRGVDVRLRVIGDGPEMADLYRQGLALGIDEVIEWYGQVWRRDLVLPLLKSSQAFVSASRFEGMPLSILEAMAAGLPLVLSDIPPHHETAGDAGLYFDPDKPQELASALESLVGDAPRRKVLGEASLGRSGLFDPDVFTDRHMGVYRQAMGR